MIKFEEFIELILNIPPCLITVNYSSETKYVTTDIKSSETTTIIIKLIEDETLESSYIVISKDKIATELHHFYTFLNITNNYDNFILEIEKYYYDN